MEIQLMYSIGAAHSRGSRNRKGITALCFRPTNISCSAFKFQGPPRPERKNISFVSKNYLYTTSTRATSKDTNQEQSIDSVSEKKKGSVVGAIALIVGTSIGSGILAVPQKTSPAGLIPSATAMIFCWAFLLIEALLLAEINVFLLLSKKKEKNITKQSFQIISIRTMAQEMLGDWGGTLATVNYVFLGYTTMVAYTSKSGDIIHRLSNVPSNISALLFALLFSILISFGGTRTTDQVNQWLTTAMIVLLVAIEAVAVSSGEWLGFGAEGNWANIPATFPVIIFTLVYHDLLPVICAYLDGDLARIRVAFIGGSLVPLLVLLVWNAVALGLLSPSDPVVDPIELLSRVGGGRVSAMVESFSLLAVGTSYIGTLLGFSQFFLEQLNSLPGFSSTTQAKMSEGKVETIVLKAERNLLDLKIWWAANKFGVTSTALAVVPPLFISTVVPDVFSAATDIAGGYCMTLLYGVLPPAMAWAMHKRWSADAGRNNGNKEENKRESITMLKPILIGVGLFACAIITEQCLQDLSVPHP
ncbi:hypothetical protein ACHQM5_013473 [Ranunculus cassubicifolius]